MAAAWYIDPATVEAGEVERNARRAYELTGISQWVHHHPHGHLCNHLCKVIPGPDVGAGLTL